MPTPATPPTETLALSDLLLACAGATVPCPNCGANQDKREALEHGPISRCHASGVCSGTGRVYCFPDTVRLPCPWHKCTQRYTIGQGMTMEALERRERYCAAGKDDCQGRTWVPNPDPYVWRQALRERGCRIAVDSFPEDIGDSVTVSSRGAEGFVNRHEGLRDQLPEVTAIYRMLEQVPGVEMPNA